MFIKRECSRQSLLSWISMTLEPANCGAARCRAAPPRLRRRAAPIAFLQGPQNDRVQTGLNSEGVTFPIPGLLLLSPALHQRANLATRQTTQFTKSTDCGSIAWFVTFTKVARGQLKVALLTLAARDEHRGAGRWRSERQGGEIAHLVHGLRDVRGPDDVLPGARRLAEFEHQGAARSTEVRRVTRQNPVEMEQAGESCDIDVRSDQHDHLGRRISQRSR